MYTALIVANRRENLKGKNKCDPLYGKTSAKSRQNMRKINATHALHLAKSQKINYVPRVFPFRPHDRSPYVCKTKYDRMRSLSFAIKSIQNHIIKDHSNTFFVQCRQKNSIEFDYFCRYKLTAIGSLVVICSMCSAIGPSSHLTNRCVSVNDFKCS